MAAPVGRSNANDAANPAALVKMPAIHPIASCLGSDEANITPMAAGMIRNENTRSTPASATELVTTMPKRCVKHEFPEQRSGLRQPVAQEKMQQRDGKVEWNDDGDFVKSAGQDIAGQDLLEMLGALRGPVDQQDRSCRRNHVDDPDERFLGHPRCPGARERQQHGRQQCEGQGVAVGRKALRGMTEHERDGRAEGGDLGQRQIDENDIAGEYLDSEVSVDADKTHRYQERWPEKCERLGHLALAASTSAATSVSNSER